MNYIRRFLLVSVCLFNGVMHTADAADVGVIFSFNLLKPTCDLTATPDNIDFGDMQTGTSAGGDIKFTVTCQSAVATYVTLSVPKVSAANPAVAEITTSGGGTPVSLYFSDSSNKPVHLNLDKTAKFCAGDATRTCSLTPGYIVHPDTDRGNISTTLRSEIIYV